MLVNDPIADMLTRIRNAQVARHDVVLVPASNMKKSIAKILLAEGYVKNVEVIQDGPQGTIKITLKYVQGQGTRKSGAISGLKRISKPGLRVYAKAGDVPKVLGGLGVALVSTSQGVITDQEANRKSVGGEVLAYIW